MNRNEQEDQTKQELPDEAKKAESNYVINAFIIGLFIGISIYSIAINGWGFFAFIPLYLAYRFMTHSKANSDLKNQVKE